MKERVLSFNQVTAAYFDEPVLEDVTLAVYSQETVGVVGRNGSGKSTLLKCLTGIHGADAGSVVRDRPVRFGYLPQEAELLRSATVLEAMRGALPELDRVEAELQEVEASMGLEEVYGDPARLEAAIARQDTLVARYAELGGPSFQRTVEATLRQVGLAEDSFGLRVADLSGGQKKLLALARILVGRPDFLVLDEPDNHLDLRGKQLLERIIGAFGGGVAIVSHDRYLLDLIVDSIIELERRKVFAWPGNYSEYVIQKEVAVASQARHYQAQQKEIKRLEESAKRLLTWGAVFDNPKFITRGKSILKRIDRIDRIDAPVTDSETMDLTLQYRRGSEKVLELTNVSFTFSDTGVQLFDRADLLVWKGERVAIVGPNGAGKSLLLNLIRGQLQPTGGTIKLGPSLKLGFYDQEHRNLDYRLNLVDTVRRDHSMTEATAVSFLRKFQFGYRQCLDPVGALSGGERSRLQMALMMLQQPNFLVLDEPTNNLDIQSAEILEEVLLGFAGAILMVSHDRYFLDRLADRVVVLQNGTLREFRGTFGDYLTNLARSRKRNPGPRRQPVSTS